MSDKLVFDLAQEVEGSPNVFIRKDWINILDNQNQNYNNNQSIIDTSQLSNSNKYMSYREAYLLVPFTLTLATTSYKTTVNGANNIAFSPGNVEAGTAGNAATCIGLKNWFGQIIHSITLDYNGTTIIQQTPYINMWNSFKLLTTLSLDDILTQGATIGFYPDDATTFEYYNAGTVAANGIVTSLPSGQGVCNNSNANNLQVMYSGAGKGFNYNAGGGNVGYTRRQTSLIFDLNGVMGFSNTASTGVAGGVAGVPLSAIANNTSVLGLIQSNTSVSSLWKSYIYKTQNQLINNTLAPGAEMQTTAGILQMAVTGIIYLKHIHSFFNMVPLLKGVFMKMTLNLNNATTSFSAISTYPGTAANVSSLINTQIIATSISVPIGGVNPLMVSSSLYNSTIVNSAGSTLAAAALAGVTGTIGTAISGINGGMALCNGGTTSLSNAVGAFAGLSNNISYRANVSVGARCLDSQLSTITNGGESPLSKSVYLYIPAYDFNPVFESAYLSSPVKTIRYTDIYQYQVLNVAANNGQFNNLLSNGIRNIKSILILPFYSSTGGSNIANNYGPANATTGNISMNTNTGFLTGTPVFQSPFDTAGTGTTSPMTWLTNFNVQVSGQNAIYNTQKYNFEQFNNQLYGQNSVNGGLTDGLTSGLIDRAAFDLTYCYYYVNIERMRPVEMSVPKSIQILGQNNCGHALDLYCFIEYGNQIDIDVITGARVG